MSKSLKRWIAAILTCMIVVSNICVVFATTGTGGGGGDTYIEPKMEKAKGKFSGIANNITGLVMFVGYGFAIGMLIYLGIKYVSSSANEKADIKKGAINYIIGAIIIVAAVTLFNLLEGFGKDVTKGEGSSLTEIAENTRLA